jgi:MFS family permease
LTILYASASFFAGNLTARLGLMKVLNMGVSINLAAGSLFALLIYLTGPNIYSMIFPLALMFFAHGFIVSMSMAKAVSDFPNIAGASSGLSSSLGLVTGGLFSILSGSMYTGEFMPIAMIVWLSTCFCYLCFLLVRSGEQKKEG